MPLGNWVAFSSGSIRRTSPTDFPGVRLGQVDVHLVPVEVRVVRRTHALVKSEGPARHHLRATHGYGSKSGSGPNEKQESFLGIVLHEKSNYAQVKHNYIVHKQALTNTTSYRGYK